MKIKKATRLYEAWLASRTDVIAADLALKHQRMAESQFSFMRATFYRWAQQFPIGCAELMGAPAPLSVGDLHVENFGTWRDAEGRLVWGVNDFDEAACLPYTNDLVRLALSAHLAIAEARLKLSPAAACDALLTGYARAFECGGKPFVLAEENRWLSDLVRGERRDPGHYWKKFESMRPLNEAQVPRAVLARLRRALPDPGLPIRIGHRLAGLGSLGRPRYVAQADWLGARIAREAKPLLPSAWELANGKHDAAIRYAKIVQRAVRAPDPCLRVDEEWVVRRLSPSCSRIELADLPHRDDETRLLEAMGFETANIHLGSDGARRAIRADLAARKAGWLHAAALRMLEALSGDFQLWRETMSSPGPASKADPPQSGG